MADSEPNYPVLHREHKKSDASNQQQKESAALNKHENKSEVFDREHKQSDASNGEQNKNKIYNGINREHKKSAASNEEQKKNEVNWERRRSSALNEEHVSNEAEKSFSDARKLSVAFTEICKDSAKDHVKTSSSGRKSSASRRRSSMLAKPIELDDVLTNELGQFGWYQTRNLILVSVPIAMCAFMTEYIFSAAAIPHRCQIPECGESSKSVPFDPPWLGGAIPSGALCERFIGGNGTLDVCPAEFFNPEVTISCQGYVYEREDSVVYDFDLGCNEWLRTLAGTMNMAGALPSQPLAGFVSDRWGRRVALIISVVNMAVFGALRAAAPNYVMYLVLQFLQTALGGGLYSSAYIFVGELVGPKYRTITSAIVSSMFALGQIILGSVAWAVESWRVLILVLHLPCLLVVGYYWMLNESVRWLLAKQRFEEAKDVLLTVARVNGTTISHKSLEALTTLNPLLDDKGTEIEDVGLFRGIIRSPTLLRRVLTTPIWWISTTFVYYGLNINSTGLAGNMYANYMATCAVEIPGYFTAVILLDRIGRRSTLAAGYLLSAACNFVFAFVSDELVSLRLSMFLVGKFMISIVFTSVYLYTMELYPTKYRHSLLAFSSMIGRVGSITAPLTPALRLAMFAVGKSMISIVLTVVYLCTVELYWDTSFVTKYRLLAFSSMIVRVGFITTPLTPAAVTYWAGLPSLLFGIMGLLGGLLVLTQPETLGQPLPDTLLEAENIGRASVAQQKI